jgi:hypothetical protein
MLLPPNIIFDLFVNRTDVFAVQQTGGQYYPVKRPITLDDIESHLKGEITIGVYCLNTDNKVKWACIDIDMPEDMDKAINDAYAIYDLFPELARALEFSGRKGYHVWIFFKNPVNAGYAQTLVKARLNRVGLNKHEIFPKQTELNEGRKYGNLVKLPLGLHKRSGKRSELLKIEGI